MESKPTTLYHRKANGKLLLTGEYFVLDGAPSIALPSIFGQYLTVDRKNTFQWTCFDQTGKIWFDFEQMPPCKEKQLILDLIKKTDLATNASYVFKIDFERLWGLGTSSTFLGLIADFTNSNPYELNQCFFKGSGYDIACCFETQPIIFQIQKDRDSPNIIQTNIPNHVKDHLYFIYTGQKQNSKQAIENYKTRPIDKSIILQSIEDINRQLLSPTTSTGRWIEQLSRHEDMVSTALGIPKISDTIMKEIPYFTKSLGAWGGDFVLCISEETKETIQNVFLSKGFDTFFSYSELILG